MNSHFLNSIILKYRIQQIWSNFGRWGLKAAFKSQLQSIQIMIIQTLPAIHYVISVAATLLRKIVDPFLRIPSGKLPPPSEP